MPTNKKNYIKNYYHKERAKIIKELGGVCLKCLCSDNLEIHHINNHHKEVSSGVGRLSRLTEWKKNTDNLALLCVGHHVIYHNHVGDNINIHTLFSYVCMTGDLNKDAIPV